MHGAIPGLLLLAGCAAASEDWPNLAQRPAEAQGQAPAAQPAAPSAPTSPAPLAAAPSAAPSDPVLLGRLATLERDLRELVTRWQAQQSATQAAVQAAAGAAVESPPWAAAQAELTRFDAFAARMLELRDRLDALAGDLAHTAAAGRLPAPALVQTGRLIAETETLRRQHLDQFNAARAALPR